VSVVAVLLLGSSDAQGQHSREMSHAQISFWMTFNMTVLA
jgi:hypothetical protein